MKGCRENTLSTLLTRLAGYKSLKSESRRNGESSNDGNNRTKRVVFLQRNTLGSRTRRQRNANKDDNNIGFLYEGLPWKFYLEDAKGQFTQSPSHAKKSIKPMDRIVFEIDLDGKQRERYKGYVSKEP